MDIPKTIIRKIIKSYNQQKNDRDRFSQIILNKEYFELFLDNDYTGVYLSNLATKNLTEADLEKNYYKLNLLDDYIGNSSGIMSLLDCLGISYQMA